MHQTLNNHRILGLARFVSRRLPRTAAYWLGRAVASIFHAFDQRGRNAVISNCHRILLFNGAENPEAEAKKMAGEVFRKFGQYLADFFRYERVMRNELPELVRIEGQKHLEDAMAMGRGVIMVTAHLGNWELGGAIIAALGYPLTSVAFPERVGKTNELFQQQRMRRGMRVLTFGSAAKGALAALARGEIVAMLADRDFTMHRDTLPFFGAPARLPTAPGRISMRTGAPILPAFILRGADNRFDLCFQPPLHPNKNDDPIRAHKFIRDAIQGAISRDPTQWFVFNDFWASGAGKNEQTAAR